MKLNISPLLLRGPLITALLAGGAPLARADEAVSTVVVTAKAERSSYQATDSSTATHIAAPLRDIPATVNVVTRAVMRDQNALSLQDTLQNVPGVSFSTGDGQRDQVMIRGFTGITDQFIDGMRDDALYFRDLSNLERVDVLKGPAAMLYGRGSAGGLLNRVSKKPVAAPLAETGLLLGSKGQRRGEFDAGTASADGRVRLRMTGALEDSTGFRNQYFLQRKAIAPSAWFDLSPHTALLLQVDYLTDRRLADQGVPSFRGRPVEVDRATYFGAANGSERASVTSDVASGTATLDHAFSDQLKLHAVVRSYDYRLDRNYTTIGKITDAVVPTVSIGQTHRTRAEHGTTLQAELVSQPDWGSSNHQLLVGVEFGRQSKQELLVSRSNVATLDLFNPQLVALGPLPASLIPIANNDNRFTTMALYLQDLMALTPEWKLLAGLRYDRLMQRRDDLTPRRMDLQRVDHTRSPRLGVVFQPRPDLALYASASQSFQPLAELTMRVGSYFLGA